MSHSSSPETPEQQPRRDRSAGHTTGRSPQRGRRPLDLTFVLALALPLLVALALFLTNPGFGTGYFHPPTRPAITRATVVCPGAAGNARGDQVGIASAGSGSVSVSAQPVGAGSSTPHTTTTTLSPGGVGAASSGKDPVVISAADAAAPGLVATRSSTTPVAAAACSRPRSDQWFTGLGAGPTHDSFVVLTNPNPGQAIADLTVLGDTGPVEVPALRGIAVPGHSSQEIDLGAVMPTRSPFALHAVVQRGQVTLAVRDRAAHLVGDSYDEDWLPSSTKPSRHNLLLGLPSGGGTRQLTVANPSDHEVTATVRLVSKDSIFTPDNAPTIDVGPESVSRVDVSQLLSSVDTDGTVGVQVVASGAVTAALRSVVDHDVSLVARSQSTSTATRVVVPPGAKHLVIGGARHVGTVTVVARAASGKQVASQRVAIEPRQGLTVSLPDGAVRVDVTPEHTSLRGAVLLTPKGGLAVVPLQRAQVTSRVPFVKPGLPR